MIDREFGRGAAERPRIRDRLHVAKIVPGEHCLRCCNPDEIWPVLYCIFRASAAVLAARSPHAPSDPPRRGRVGDARKRASGWGRSLSRPSCPNTRCARVDPPPPGGGCHRPRLMHRLSSCLLNPAFPVPAARFAPELCHREPPRKNEGGAGRRGRVRTRGLVASRETQAERALSIRHRSIWQSASPPFLQRPARGV